MTVTVIQGDCRDVLKTLPDESVHCVVTSPPYWGLRDYGHDGQIGLEDTPQAFVDNLLLVLAECRRVLRADGTLWLNLGDSYAAGRGGTAMPAETLAGGLGGRGDADAHRGRLAQVPNNKNPNAPIATYQPHRNAGAIGLKHKDLVGVPWRVAFAAQASGWYLRQDIIWHKPNPMPESVRDRCTKAHEYLFLLAKSERYYFDQDAITEPVAPSQVGRVRDDVIGGNKGDAVHHSPGGRYTTTSGNKQRVPATERDCPRDGVASGVPWEGSERNKRSVWTVTTQPFKDAHFATFPPDLIEPCILAGCPEGGTVLDPFGGAGTTGLVADRHKRDAILIELNPEYAEMARRRIFNDAPLFAEVR
jgi:DNA modification methylase